MLLLVPYAAGDAIAQLSCLQSTSRLESVTQGLHHLQGSGVSLPPAIYVVGGVRISHLFLWQNCLGTVRLCEIQRKGCCVVLLVGQWSHHHLTQNGQWLETVVCHILPFASQICLLQSCFQSGPIKKQPRWGSLQFCLADVDFIKTHWHIHIVLAGGVCVWINITTHDVESSYCGNEACFLITVCGEIVRNAWLCSVDRVWYITHL